jgi:hypothetical protein
MGTDIHMWVETRENADSPWKLDDRKIWPYPYFDKDRPANVLETYGEPGTEGYWEYISNPEFTEHPYERRNYTLFGVLANVRNGTGFAGCEIGRWVEPIARPKGFPEDASPEMRKIYDEEFEHTATWLSLRELVEYQWDQAYSYTGVLSEAQYEALKNGTIPEDWCGGVSGKGILTLNEDDYDERKRAGKLPTTYYEPYALGWGLPSSTLAVKKIYVKAHWVNPGGLRTALGDAWFDALTKLQETYDNDLDNVRLVFWFDS